ncbi:hypothetical protein NQZ68_003912 [Dissostichus eleginoides]|nr:hypothetical protein NQZ68_003912 [Dissostichus eleginoides]
MQHWNTYCLAFRLLTQHCSFDISRYRFREKRHLLVTPESVINTQPQGVPPGLCYGNCTLMRTTTSLSE